MSATTVRRLIVVTLVWAVVFVAMVLTGMGPRPLLLALAIGIVSGGALLAAEVGATVASANWRVEAELAASSLRGRDVFVERLRLQVVRLHDPDTPNETLAPMLVDLIDDRVRRNAGVERSADPDAFARAAGPLLAAFVTATAHGERVMTRHSLGDVLDGIEAL